MTDSSYMIAPGDTTDSMSMRRRLALALAQKNMQPPQIDHWTQGLAHLANNAISGYQIGALDREEKEETAKGNALLAQLFSGGQPGAAPTSPTSAPASAGGFGEAIAGIESGGKYDALGPQTKTGDRAFGKYQVMGANVPEWTKAHLGRPMTPEEFLADPKAQDAVFQGQFGQYAQKYGPEGAARAWFAGEGGMNDLGRKDQLGTSVGQYGQRFAQALQTQPESAQGAPNRDAVIQMLGNRRTAPIAQGIIQKSVGAQFEPVKPTDEMREYDLYRKQGGKESFYDYKTGLKRAGAIQNTVQIDQKGETEFSKESGKLQAKRFNDLAEDAPAAKQMLSDVETLRELGAKIETGKGAEARAALGPYAKALGIDVQGLDEIQGYEAIVNRVAPNLRVKGSGAQSDFELKNFMKSLPSIGNTPGGNEIAQKVLEGLYQNKITAAEIGAKALNGEVTRTQAEKMLRDLPDPMKEWREFNKATKASSPSAAPDRSAVEQEMRRRGLLK